VLLGANELEAMQEKIDLLSDVQTSLNQLAKGEGISHQKAKSLRQNRMRFSTVSSQSSVRHGGRIKSR
jgi:hypothetical protein